MTFKNDTYSARCMDCKAYIAGNILPLKSFEKWAMDHAVRTGHRMLIRKRRPYGGSDVIESMHGTMKECQTKD
jgi:hypothetical protein